MTSAIPVQCSTSWAIKPTGSLPLRVCNISVEEYMKVHIIELCMYGFESLLGLKFFQSQISQLLKLCAKLQWSIMSSQGCNFLCNLVSSVQGHSQANSQTVRQSVSQSVSQSVNQSVRQTGRQAGRQAGSQPISQTLGEVLSQQRVFGIVN